MIDSIDFEVQYAMRLYLLLLFLSGCAPLQNSRESAPTPSPKPVATPVAEIAGPGDAAVSPKTAVEPTADQKEKAALFDRFLGKKLGEDEKQELEDGCAKEPSQNPFCFAILNRDSMEEKLHPKPDPRSGHPHVRPHFSSGDSEGEITNWEELRADSINHLLKTFANLKLSRLEQIKSAALAESHCPNNAAVAIAATLEDELPEGEDFGELAQLYEKGGDCVTDPDNKENLLTRAGLFQYVKKDYARAAAIFERSAAVEAAKSPRPFFWLYRIGIERGDRLAAQSALSRLKEKFPFSFHTVMARLREGQSPDDILAQDSPSSVARTAHGSKANTLVEEAEILRSCGFSQSASKLLDWAVVESVGSEPEFRLYLAELKAALDETRASIFVLSKVLIDFPRFTSTKTLKLFYPKAFFELFEKHAAGIDPYLLLSIARQESAFDAKAVSSARAKGLLQLIGKRVRQSSKKTLFDPETNIRAGAKLIASLLEENGGHVHQALGAYNAGPRRMSVWLERYPTIDAMLFIDLIPYKETRAYVGLILRNYYWYHRIYSPADNPLPWLALNSPERALWLGPESLALKSAP